MHKEPVKPGHLQHKVRPEVKAWIEQEAKAQERSQAWLLNKIIEDAFSRAHQPQGTHA